jgi:hypothetical protein
MPINIKRMAGSILPVAAPEAARVVPSEPVWLWRVSATKGNVVHQITTRSFDAMKGIIALRKRAGWKVAHRIKVRAVR